MELRFWSMIWLIVFGAGCGRSGPAYYEKHVTFPEGATVEEKVEMASRLVPSPRQEAWQRLELTAFLHFGINTFTDREWGDGKENPVWFAPTGLDAEQLHIPSHRRRGKTERAMSSENCGTLATSTG